MIQLFHYALKPDGLLLLGQSETIGTLPDLFEIRDDKRLKLYAKKAPPSRTQFNFLGEHAEVSRPERNTTTDATTKPAPHSVEPRATVTDAKEADLLRRMVDRITLSRYAPVGVLCNDELNILEFRGDTAVFLANPPGPPSLNLNKLVRPELLPELSAAIREARRGGVPVRKTGLRIESAGQAREVCLEIIPVPRAPAEGAWFLIFFEETPPPQPAVETQPTGLMELLGARLRSGLTARAQVTRHTELKHDVVQVTRELAATRSHMQAMVEEFETAMEELQSAQEELLSSNEEFQSTNEELETAKEELQSTNEELATTNDELRQRNVELKESIDEL